MKNGHSETHNYVQNLCYKLKKMSKEFQFKEVGEKMECPFCKIACKNIKLHFDRNSDCAKKIDMAHFTERFERYKKIIDQEKEALKRKRNLESDPDYYNKAKAKSRKKQQSGDPAKLQKAQHEGREKSRIAMQKLREKQQAEDPVKFQKAQLEGREKNRKAVQKSREKQQAEDPVKF